MMRHLISRLILAGVYLGMAVAPAPASGEDADVLATVRIDRPVLADGRPLPMGTYQLRLSAEPRAALAGQPQDAQVSVELVAGGVTVAREVAEVLRDDDLPDIGASSQPARDGVRVEMLKGGEFLRVSVKRGAIRYLVHLPVIREDDRP